MRTHFARSQRRIVANVLAVTTFQNGSPMVFVVFVKTSNPLLHPIVRPARNLYLSSCVRSVATTE